MRDVDAEHGAALGRRDEPAGPSGLGSSRRVGALPGPSDGARWLRRGASAVGTAALVVAAAAASHYGGEFSDMPALGLGAPVPSVIAKLGRRNDRVLLAPMQHLAYCNLPKAASSTVTTYMTGLNVNIHKFSDVEKFIVERGGDSHFAMVRYSTFHEAGLEHWRNSSAPPYRYFTVVRHPGETDYTRTRTFPIVPPDPPSEPSPATRRPTTTPIMTPRPTPARSDTHRHAAVQHVVR